MPQDPKTLESRRNFLMATAATVMVGGALSSATPVPAAAVDLATLPRVKQTLVAPPFMPEH